MRDEGDAGERTRRHGDGATRGFVTYAGSFLLSPRPMSPCACVALLPRVRVSPHLRVCLLGLPPFRQQRLGCLIRVGWLLLGSQL